MKACRRCQHGLPAMDGPTPFILCARLPPGGFVVHVPDPANPTEKRETLTWQRPPMALHGWCGEFKLSIARLFGYGARA